MQIIVPMSGVGERFKRAGYSVPKPLIVVEGKPIIAHVINMFPDEADFIFICNQAHLDNHHYEMQAVLRKWCPTGKVVGISPHKYGPVYAVLQATDFIDTTKPTLVNYCDFACYWDWQHFKKWLATLNCAGAVPAYRGFHPHSLGTTNYAYIQEKNGWMTAIQEKQPYTNDRMQEYASSGTYYFSSGKLMLDAFKETLEQHWHVGEEYYVSLAYRYLLQNNLSVAIYPLQHFMQWGTPEDLNEYMYWSQTFHRLSQKRQSLSIANAALIIPMAGLGQRFVKEGYTTPKPLIEVSGQPMLFQAINDLPQAKYHAFVLRSDMAHYEEIQGKLSKHYTNASIIKVAEVTEGQACSVLLGLEKLMQDVNESELGPVIVGACDNGALYDSHQLDVLMNDSETDVIVWGIRGYPNAMRYPTMYGWIECAGNHINRVLVKTPPLEKNSPIVLGTFIFKKAADLRRCIHHLMARGERVNNEFYLDSCINDALQLGLKCKVFAVNHYLCWGTPNDLKTFEYWQSCYHKWRTHPYRLEADARIAAEKRNVLVAQYQPMVPALLEPYL